METCKGFEDWLSCLKCPYLCTKLCPIEREDVMEEFKRRIRLLDQKPAYFEGSRSLEKL
jgi:hypothetical protein